MKYKRRGRNKNSQNVIAVTTNGWLETTDNQLTRGHRSKLYMDAKASGAQRPISIIYVVCIYKTKEITPGGKWKSGDC